MLHFDAHLRGAGPQEQGKDKVHLLRAPHQRRQVRHDVVRQPEGRRGDGKQHLRTFAEPARGARGSPLAMARARTAAMVSINSGLLMSRNSPTTILPVSACWLRFWVKFSSGLDLVSAASASSPGPPSPSCRSRPRTVRSWRG